MRYPLHIYYRQKFKEVAGFFPLLCKEGPGEVDLPLLSSPYKGEGTDMLAFKKFGC
jgi:hypothetical protein